MNVLIATATAGGGHLAAASALADAWKALRPGDHVEKLDLLTFFSPLHRKLYTRGYESLVEHAPKIWGLLFAKTDDPRMAARLNRLRRVFTPSSNLKLERHLKRTRPGVVLCTHHAPIAALGRFVGPAPQSASGAERPFVASVVTDFVAHALWMGGAVDLYCVAAEVTSARLVERGVPPGRIAVTGIPIAVKFAQPVDIRDVRQRYGLRDDQPVILLLGGGFGWGPISKALAELDKLDARFQTLVVCGRNAGLRREIAAQDRKHPTHVLGFVANIHELMTVADLVVTKPGGLTTSEALARGLPMVVLPPIPGQEAANSDFLLEAGAAVKVNRIEEMSQHVGQLLGTKKLEVMAASARASGRPASARNVCEEVLRRLKA